MSRGNSYQGDGEERPHTNSKVGRVIDQYDLADLGDRLVTYWTGEDDEQYSLRELAEQFNKRVLRAAMTEAGVDTLDGEVENTYRLLTDDDISRGMRTQARKNLERQGVDVDAVERDFVSHQAVHTYLTKYRGVEHPSQADEGDQVEKDIETIQRLQSRTTVVTENTLERLANTGRIDLGRFDVIVDASVICEECGRQYGVSELLSAGGCDCGAD